MLASILVLASLAFAESKAIAVQICLDRAGYSCNTIDGTWGGKSQRALELYAADRGLRVPATPDEAYDQFFSNAADLFRIETVTQADLDALVVMPTTPAEKARLTRMGYSSILEMFAERGHLSKRAMERMNPGVDWNHVPPGLRLVIPNFPSMSEYLAAWPRKRSNERKWPTAALVRVSLSRCEITAFDAKGGRLAVFPCSIARDKTKRPQQGELKIVGPVANPNYTYTPDSVSPGKKTKKYILPAGPRCPVGVAWLGLTLPGYGIHGTPRPESIGNAESHGCFRLANWNAARLYAMCKPGTKVVVAE